MTSLYFAAASFILVMVALGLLRILRRMSFKSAGGRLSPIESAVTLRPKQGPRLLIERVA